eukprot:c7610_g1_i1.p1 GENE.c7610_g1_i1~~c7610_g1_i1.p1  ORF type:complete len:290 (+),score=72.90 c7610_g1_i1:24-872(+)
MTPNLFFLVCAALAAVACASSQDRYLGLAGDVTLCFSDCEFDWENSEVDIKVRLALALDIAIEQETRFTNINNHMELHNITFEFNPQPTCNCTASLGFHTLLRDSGVINFQTAFLVLTQVLQSNVALREFTLNSYWSYWAAAISPTAMIFENMSLSNASAPPPPAQRNASCHDGLDWSGWNQPYQGPTHKPHHRTRSTFVMLLLIVGGYLIARHCRKMRAGHVTTTTASTTTTAVPVAVSITLQASTDTDSLHTTTKSSEMQIASVVFDVQGANPASRAIVP